MINAWEATGVRVADFSQPPVLSWVRLEPLREGDTMAALSRNGKTGDHTDREQDSSTGIGCTFHTSWAYSPMARSEEK